MQHAHHTLPSILITLLLASIAPGGTETPDPVDETVQVLRDCMAKSPAPWPDAWKREYFETLRRAIAPHLDTPHYEARLEILRKGFAPYWEGFEKLPERSLFEVRQAQIRWYVEHLIGTKFPTNQGKSIRCLRGDRD